jgi:hypothetical protein
LVRYIFILLPISVSYSKQLTPFSWCLAANRFIKQNKSFCHHNE